MNFQCFTLQSVSQVQIMGTIALIFCSLLNFTFGNFYKKTPISCFEEIGSTTEAKTLIECCGFCSVTPNCQGVIYDKTTCTAIKEVMKWSPNGTMAWIDSSLKIPKRKGLQLESSYFFIEFVNFSQ